MAGTAAAAPAPTAGLHLPAWQAWPRLPHLFLFGDSLCAERGDLNRRQGFVVVDPTTRQTQKLKNKPASSEVDKMFQKPKSLTHQTASTRGSKNPAPRRVPGRLAASPSKPKVPLRPGLSERPRVLGPVPQEHACLPWRWAPGGA